MTVPSDGSDDSDGRSDGGADPDGAVPARLRLAVGRLNRRMRVDAAAALPPLQTSVLMTLEEHAPLRLSDLARREAVTPPTMSRVLTALSEAGLLVRRADPQDARSSLVELSDKGAATVTSMRGERTVRLAERLDKLTPDQRAALEHALPALEELASMPRG